MDAFRDHLTKGRGEAVDPCSRNLTTGSAILFDEFANNVVAAGVVVAFLGDLR